MTVRFSSFVVAVEYTLPVVWHILRVDSDDKGAGYAASVSSSPVYHGTRFVTFRFSSFVVAVEYTFPGILHTTLHVGRYIELFV